MLTMCKCFADPEPKVPTKLTISTRSLYTRSGSSWLFLQLLVAVRSALAMRSVTVDKDPTAVMTKAEDEDAASIMAISAALCRAGTRSCPGGIRTACARRQPDGKASGDAQGRLLVVVATAGGSCCWAMFIVWTAAARHQDDALQYYIVTLESSCWRFFA
jgi:hypothetical protein